LEKQISNMKDAFQDKLNMMYDRKPLELSNIKFKKIDLKEREKELSETASTNDQITNTIKNRECIKIIHSVPYEHVTIRNKEHVKVGHSVPPVDKMKSDFDDKESVNSCISNQPTHENSVYSHMNSVRSNSSFANDKRPPLTVQEKLKFSSGKTYHNKK